MKSFILLLGLLFCTIVSADMRPTPPTAETVFQLRVKRYDPNTFLLHWHIKPGFFLYQKSIRLIEPPKAHRFATITPLDLPHAITKKDTKGRSFEVYREKLTLPVRLLGMSPGETIIHITFQGCADDGYCYPPKTMPIQLTFDKNLALVNSILEQATAISPDVTSLKHLLKNPFETQLILTLLIFYILGLLLSFTPCVLPMIPVLSSIIVGRGAHLSGRHAFGLSLTYVLSMSATYAIVGAIIALVGKNIQITLQAPWMIGVLSGLFIILALSMFDLFELRLPTAWQSKLAAISYGQAHGHYINALVMGALSTLILSPCVTAPLIGALSYIAETGRLFLGVSALFILGLGMGTPLLLIGTSLGRLLPHKGAWMNQVKGFFGLILMGVAIDLVSRITPPLISMLLWATLFLFSGLYLGVFKSSQTNLSKLKQVLALIIFIYGFLILIGASQGHTNPWMPLSTSTHAHHPTVRSLQDLQPILQHAKIHQQPVLIDFYADWCRSCKIIEDELESNQKIQTMLSSFEVIRADITEDNAKTQALSTYYRVVAPPTFVFISKDGVELKTLTHAGEISMNELDALLQEALE